MDPLAQQPLDPGSLNMALANAIGKIEAEYTGRGSARSRAFVDRDVVVCILHDDATPSERRLIAAGRAEDVRQQRDVLHRLMEPDLVACVEGLTGRNVASFLTGSSTAAGSSVDVFVLAPHQPVPVVVGRA